MASSSQPCFTRNGRTWGTRRTRWTPWPCCGGDRRLLTDTKHAGYVRGFHEVPYGPRDQGLPTLQPLTSLRAPWPSAAITTSSHHRQHKWKITAFRFIWVRLLAAAGGVGSVWRGNWEIENLTSHSLVAPRGCRRIIIDTHTLVYQYPLAGAHRLWGLNGFKY